MRSRRRIYEQPGMYDTHLPPFASTQSEIKRAVERGAIHRGSLLSKVIVSLHIDEILEIIKAIEYDKEEIHERKDELNVDEAALICLDITNPPISYLFYFSVPEFLIEHPELVMYYRNVAMLSRKVMRGIGLPTDAQEDRGIPPSQDDAVELARYFNGIISKFITAAGVTPNRHLEIALSNLGDALGGISRNEVGRYAAAEIMHYLITYWYRLGYLHSIKFTLKRNYDVDDKDDDDQYTGEQQTLTVIPQLDILEWLNMVEANRVKYQEIVLNNDYHLLIDRQLTWTEQSDENRTYRIGPDMVSKSVSIDMVWAGELKGGADPAGSDEHWKTATQALSRILEAAEKTGKPQPKLSFLATILVDRVAIEAQQWINDGKLTSVYNLTKIAESEEELQRFLDDMTYFLGYSNNNKGKINAKQ